MSLVLLDSPFHSRGIAIKITALYAKVPLEHKLVTDKKAILLNKELAKINPNGEVPALLTSEGPLTQTSAILRHIVREGRAEKLLYGSTSFESSQVDQWIDIVNFEIVSQLATLNYPVLGKKPFDADADLKAREKVEKAFKVFDDHLFIRNFLVGTRISVADIFAVTALTFLFKYSIGEDTRRKFPNLVRYWKFCASQQPFISVLGRPYPVATPLNPKHENIEFNQSPVVVDKQQGASSNPAGNKPSEEKKKEPANQQKPDQKQKDAKPAEGKKEAQKETKEAPKQDQPKKEQGKKQKEEDDDDGEQDPLKELNKKSELDSLPPSSLNLMEFKTLYVNSKDKKETIDNLFKFFDHEGWSIWLVKYIKFGKEGQQLIPFSNGLGGFIDRMEAFRKYCFGTYSIYGEEPTLEIRGIWMWRGTKIPDVLKDHVSFENNTYEQLNLSSEVDKKKIEEYWTGSEEDVSIVDGLRVRRFKYVL